MHVHLFVWMCPQVSELVNETYGLVLWKPVMEVDGLRLIAEVRKRPKLWVKKRKKNMDKLWAEVGKILETDASLCKRTWQIMRIRFWVETKRILTRIAKAKEKGTYNPKRKYTTWHLYDTLRFLENIKSGHRKYHSVSDNSDVKIVKSKNALQTHFPKQRSIKSKNLPNENANASQTRAVDETDDSEQDIKNFDSHSPESECATTSNENTAHLSNTFFKEEPEFQIDTGMHLTENENISAFKETNSSALATSQASHYFEGANFVVSIKEENPDQSMPLEGHYSRPPDISDENYCFLYSFLSQTKLLSQSQKVEFHIKMKSLLLHICPAPSVDILENQLLLAVDDDPDKNFLINVWPFMASMSLSQNLQFRTKMADLVFNCLLPKTEQNFM